MSRVIAIDGPVGSGKSTIAKALAERLGLPMLSTGAMYRAVAAAALQRGIEPGPDTTQELVELARGVTVDDAQRVLVHGQDMTAELRNPGVNRAVSVIASDPAVRKEMVERQRKWAEKHSGGVVEGRDIGTVVFPDADLKVFLTASLEERARRRGADEDPADLARRDELDSTRSASPLTTAPDAVVIDSTELSVEEVVEDIVGRL